MVRNLDEVCSILFVEFTLISLSNGFLAFSPANITELCLKSWDRVCFFFRSGCVCRVYSCGCFMLSKAA